MVRVGREGICVRVVGGGFLGIFWCIENLFVGFFFRNWFMGNKDWVRMFVFMKGVVKYGFL